MSVLQKDNNGVITNYSGLGTTNEGLPLGLIFSSALPQSNQNYHLLNGDSLAIANYNDFYTLLTTLVSQSWNLTCTANEYAEDIAKTGNCGKFVINTNDSDITGTYDTTTITVTANSFKLPTITRFIQGISSITGRVGTNNNDDYQYAGLLGYRAITNKTQSGALDYEGNTYGIAQNGGSANAVAKAVKTITFDASKSSSIYKNSITTVQPASTQYLYYIVVKTNSTIGLMNYLNDLAQAGVQSLGGSVGDITLGSGLKIVNNVLSVKTQVLWTNPTPNDSFVAQNITLSSSDYDYLIINFINANQSIMIAKGENCQALFAKNSWYTYENDSIQTTRRNINYVDDTTLSVENCSAIFWLASRNAVTLTSNNNSKPTEIIGIKL